MSEPSLADLDRCLHGRHAVDPCLGCPGGWSMGNAYLVDGQRIGTDLGGKPILVGLVKGPLRRREAPAGEILNTLDTEALRTFEAEQKAWEIGG